MVELSRFNSNNYKAILRFKHQIIGCSGSIPKSIIPDSPICCNENRVMGEFGETEVKRLQQPFRIDFSEDDIQKIIDDYSVGVSTLKIAKQYNCCKQTISTLLKKHGVEVSNRKAQKKLPADEIVSMYESERKTIHKIADIFQVSDFSIRRCLLNHGVKMRNRWDYDLR